MGRQNWESHPLARSLENLFKFLHSLILICAIDSSHLTSQTLESRLIYLSFREGLIWLAHIPMQIANNFRDRDGITGIDFSLIFLGPPAPHCPLDPRPALERGHCVVHGLSITELLGDQKYPFSPSELEGHAIVVKRHHHEL